ncbi:MAG: FtsH protease activity modulator HflK [Nevskiaceae bacterium]|jgi:membrane protease subunit HflK|nr:FtsH protease activity modulator HflK [Nevskiaceae bacterium]
MAWNEPGKRNESPWGKRKPPPGGDNNAVDAALKNFQRRLDALFGNNGGSGGGGEGGAPNDSSSSSSLGGYVLAGVLLLWLASGFFQIEASDRGVVQRFGKFVGVRDPGWGYVMPWPIETVTKVNVSEYKSVEDRSRMLTADVNLVEIRSTVQYVYADPVKALFSVRDPESTLREVGESAIREIVGQSTLDEVLGVGRQQITDNTIDLIQRTLDMYDSGIRVSSVNLTDVQVPDAVIAAQRDANKAIEDRDRFGKEAQAYTNDILPRAQGMAQRQMQDAEAYRAQVVAMAEGDVARFDNVYGVYAKAPEVTRQRMYVETIEQMMQQSGKVIVDSRGGQQGNMIYLPLDRLGERINRSAVPSSSTAAPVTVPELPAVTVDGSRSRGTR